jgi:predicted kinase
MATLYIFSGLPGTGKSTLATRLSMHLGASYLRVDTIEQSLKDLCGLKVYAEGYQLAYRLASDNLIQGLNVVGDSCNSVPESRDEWQQTAIDSGAKYVNIEIYCSNKVEHKTRVVNRDSSVKGLILPSWESVKARKYHSWDSEVISIDTAGELPEQSIQKLIERLGV